jgi:hypothetical protein
VPALRPSALADAQLDTVVSSDAQSSMKPSSSTQLHIVIPPLFCRQHAHGLPSAPATSLHPVVAFSFRYGVGPYPQAQFVVLLLG